MAPGKAFGDQLLGHEALHELDNLEVGDALNLWVLLQVEVLLGIKHSLCVRSQDIRCQPEKVSRV